MNVTFDSNARLAEEFNTNLFLVPETSATTSASQQPTGDVWGQGVDGGMTVTGIDRNWKTAASANFQNRWYVTGSRLNYYNQFFSWKNSYFTDRSKFALDLQYNNDTTLTSLADLTSSLGYVFARVPRTDRVVSPQWSYALTPRTLLNAAFNYRDSTYEHSLSGDRQGTNIFPDSRSYLGSVDLTYEWSKRLQVFGSSYYSYYALTYPANINPSDQIPVEVFPGRFFPFQGTVFSPQITSDIQTASLSLGFKYLATETVDVNLSAGVQRNQTHRPAYDNLTRLEFPDGTTVRGPNLPAAGLSSNSFTEIFALGVNKRLQSGSVALQYTRSISPNLLGDLITSDGITVLGQYNFSSRLTSSMNLSYYDQTFPGGNTRTNNTPIAQNINRYGMESTVNWFFVENWSLNASYRFFYQEYHTTTDESAVSHGVYVYILHSFDQLRL